MPPNPPSCLAPSVPVETTLEKSCICPYPCCEMTLCPPTLPPPPVFQSMLQPCTHSHFAHIYKLCDSLDSEDSKLHNLESWILIWVGDELVHLLISPKPNLTNGPLFLWKACLTFGHQLKIDQGNWCSGGKNQEIVGWWGFEMGETWRKTMNWWLTCKLVLESTLSVVINLNTIRLFQNYAIYVEFCQCYATKHPCRVGWARFHLHNHINNVRSRKCKLSFTAFHYLDQLSVDNQVFAQTCTQPTFSPWQLIMDCLTSFLSDSDDADDSDSDSSDSSDDSSSSDSSGSSDTVSSDTDSSSNTSSSSKSDSDSDSSDSSSHARHKKAKYRKKNWCKLMQLDIQGIPNQNQSGMDGFAVISILSMDVGSYSCDFPPYSSVGSTRTATLPPVRK